MEEAGGILNSEEIAQRTGMPEETVKSTGQELVEEGLVLEGKITDKGIEALEPYRVKRAVFIAAGFGSRLVPITINTPKPLVRVHGIRIIDRLIDACLENG
ncbi:MAG: CTP--phosphocholine cytidylyltransferase, partial [Eubacterium sp.]|nr:CTP--phosphocholine cytidylyltransferase [Eubacterium sp.]